MAGELIATNIRLPKKDLLLYRAVALEEGVSFSEYIRRLLKRTVMSVSLPKAKRMSKKRSLWDVGRYAVKIGIKDGSVNHDKYIYSR